MATNRVTISGMFGEGHTYFADSPVVIKISGLYWGETVTSPFTVVRVQVKFAGSVVGEFRADTGGQTEISFDISSALRAIWSGFDFEREVATANRARASSSTAGTYAAADSDYQNGVRLGRAYSLAIFTEYLDSQDGEFTTTQCEDEDGNTDIPGGQCCIGRLTEWERSNIANAQDADIAYWEGTNLRNGDASTKPRTTPERVGRDSITSWVDLQQEGTRSVFYPSATGNGADDSRSAHAPTVVRDSQPYVDFLFVNRRGAVETCSALMKESMGIEVGTTQYARVERPTFRPSRSLMAVASGGRRSWDMSSGMQTREWTEWWTVEFLMARQWWMQYQGKFVPVVVAPAKKQTGIYDRAKQTMASVEFTVTLALEG